MCYAIPGKVVAIKNSTVVVDYFGEQKKAHNSFYKLNVGEYVYAQGGVVVQKISAHEAEPILATWRELFFQLKQQDLRLTREPKTLYQIANSVRQRHLGNACCVHGIIEFSNYCEQNCLYCGIRKGNVRLKRYRMNIAEIVKTAKYAVNELGFKALVLQSGEDSWYARLKLISLVKEIMANVPVFLILSIGERDVATFAELYQAGARGILLRFETSKTELYSKLKPGRKLEERLSLLKKLKELGYLLFTGFLIGLPGQTEKDVLNDIHLTGKIGADMFSFGPFLPHPETPLRAVQPPTLKTVLTATARARLLYPEAKILATTALETLAGEKGLRSALSSGANSLMINVTPAKYQQLYEIYPNRASANPLKAKIKKCLNLLYDLGRAPTDIGTHLS